MRYSLLAGGKRLRPVLGLAACDLIGGDESDLQALGDRDGGGRVAGETTCFDLNSLSSILLSPHRNMIKLFKVKEKQRELAENAINGIPTKKQSAGELRLHKDISELNLPKSCNITFPNGKDDLMNFEVSIRPDEGYYLGGTFFFSFTVSPIYPHEAPKVKCKTKVYHPNIDLEGNVCLNILREDWKPVLNINTVIYGLYHLFTEPNDEDPLNHDAAAVLRDNPKLFESNVASDFNGKRRFGLEDVDGGTQYDSARDRDRE
ncbi:NEDD8-conjugating enzyme Ubc12, partial [Cucurbita argyrosperma subsp. sororia]